MVVRLRLPYSSIGSCIYQAIVPMDNMSHDTSTLTKIVHLHLARAFSVRHQACVVQKESLNDKSSHLNSTVSTLDCTPRCGIEHNGKSLQASVSKVDNTQIWCDDVDHTHRSDESTVTNPVLMRQACVSHLVGLMPVRLAGILQSCTHDCQVLLLTLICFLPDAISRDFKMTTTL